MLSLSLVKPGRVGALWPHLEPTLAPAIATGLKSPDQVRQDLIDGRTQCWVATGDAEGQGLLVTRVDEATDNGALALWIVYVAGTVSGGPKQRGATMRRLLNGFEQMARDRGCAEVRVTPDRSWTAVLSDYERNGRNYRKVL